MKQENYIKCSKDELEELKLKFQSGWLPESLEKAKSILNTFSVQYKDDEILVNGRVYCKQNN